MKLAERFSKGRSSDSFLYFAFGSNLSSERIRVKNPSAKFVSTALLKGYRLTFNAHSTRWRGSPATIVKCDDTSNDCVYGVLWELSNDNLPTLDEQEGVHLKTYQRFLVKVSPRGSDGRYEGEDLVDAYTYQLCSHRLTLSEAEAKPSLSYKQVILRGAHEHSLPDDYLTKLKAIQDNGNDQHVDLNLAVAQAEKD